ncbi:MAG: chorismate-binding protein [Actinomycetota bacterium]|nr:chorismate-binding protein [Actinomycetota bacterium]
MTILNQPLLTTLSTRTVRMTSPGSLLGLLPDDAPVAWVRAGEGLVGWGEAARIELTGPHQVSRAERWWAELVATAQVTDEVALPGSGLVCFGSFAFDAEASSSVLVVPEVVVGHQQGTWFLTTVAGREAAPPRSLATRPTGPVTYDERGASAADFPAIVAEVVERIRRGEVAKVVLARDVVARTEQPLDLRGPLRRLAARYDDCWTFAVDGLFGATPELLVRLADGVVTSRVLAGTTPRGDEAADRERADGLLASAKEREEHAHAVTSVRDALAPLCTAMDVPDEPFVLTLPNLMHLATDVSGVAADSATVLSLLEALHPTAAVCGTPRRVAQEVLREVERLDRGRYAGPVGWLDARGDGEWGIALRCAQVDRDDPTRVRLFAGCGIVADSDPAAELAESEAKMRPVREALQA